MGRDRICPNREIGLDPPAKRFRRISISLKLKQYHSPNLPVQIGGELVRVRPLFECRKRVFALATQKQPSGTVLGGLHHIYKLAA